MKKFFASVLAIVLVLLATGCGDTAPTESEKTKILLLGNSHSLDTFLALPEICKAEGCNNYVFGVAYRAKGSLTIHESNMINQVEDYIYYLSNPDVSGGIWRKPVGKDYNGTPAKSTADYILGAEDWDYVFIQIGSGEVLNADIHASSRQTVVNRIKSIRPNAKIGTTCSWLAPYSDDPNANMSKWISTYEAYNRVGSTPAEHFKVHCDAMKNYILPDPVYSSNNCVGTAIYYANQVLGVSSDDLYRDPVHMSQFGRGLAAYSFLTQFLCKAIDEVRLTTLSGAVAPSGNDSLTLTDEQKNIIKSSANCALNNPWEVPVAE